MHVLLNYNLPPWLVTKRFLLMLALLIPRKKSITYRKLWKDMCVFEAILKGSMAQGYIMDEAMGFCIDYMQHCCKNEHRMWDDKEESTINSEVIERNVRHRLLPDELRCFIHEFVLNNAEPLQVSESKSTYFVLLLLWLHCWLVMAVINTHNVTKCITRYASQN